MNAWFSNSRLGDLLAQAKNNVAYVGIEWVKAFGKSWDFGKILPCLEFVDDR